MRRNELATESAFDRDFNFITGVERSLERAERDAENRGIPIDHEPDAGENGVGQKRRRPNPGLVKGEAAYLRAAANGRVNVVRAPRGMSRNRQNTSKWHPKYAREIPHLFPFIFSLVPIKIGVYSKVN